MVRVYTEGRRVTKYDRYHAEHAVAITVVWLVQSASERRNKVVESPAILAGESM